MQTAVKSFSSTPQPPELYADVLKNIVYRFSKRLDRLGNYVCREINHLKKYLCTDFIALVVVFFVFKRNKETYFMNNPRITEIFITAWHTAANFNLTTTVGTIRAPFLLASESESHSYTFRTAKVQQSAVRYSVKTYVRTPEHVGLPRRCAVSGQDNPVK